MSYYIISLSAYVYIYSPRIASNYNINKNVSVLHTCYLQRGLNLEKDVLRTCLFYSMSFLIKDVKY